MTHELILVLDFLKSQPRNKLVFYKETIKDLTEIDLGTKLSQVFINNKDLSKLPMKATIKLESILIAATFDHRVFGRVLAVSNIGILFEPELKIDFRTFLNKYSNNNLLFVKWDGEIENGKLYFLTKQNGIEININELSHISI